jgi:hypothetical protein
MSNLEMLSPQNHAIALIDYLMRCVRACNRTIGVHIIVSFKPPRGTVEAGTSAIIPTVANARLVLVEVALRERRS